MRIRDVITEENIFATWAAKGLSKLAPRTAGRIASKADALESLTNAWAVELQTYGKIVTKADKVVGANYAQDAALVARAQKEATKIANQAKYKTNVAAMEKKLGAAGSTVIKFAVTAGWFDALYSAYTEISELNDKLANKQITPEQHENDVRYYLGKCVTQIAAIAVSGGIFKVGAIGLKTIPILPFAGAIGNALASLSGVAAAGVSAWFMSAEGSKYFAEWYASNALSAILTRQIAGNMSKNAYDYILRSVDDIKNGKMPAMPFASKDDDGVDFSPEPAKERPAQFDPVTRTWSAGKI